MFKLLKKLIVYFRTIEIYEKKKIYFLNVTKAINLKFIKALRALNQKQF